ncbi:uncharacterized protein Pyn_32279 [Prunus yedoensis var. nudiflora]|uniref:Uncharacterized protein n=1 Tax=Prunus yedoensis var. nudiflora TaxID=2094558 RepID=A0A314ZFC8_PRUYE|nr:uncharacterized protein Pyn_32279 [Prunus yedoensis var. nudiflora]
MADSTHQWKQHNFTYCTEFPMPLGCQTLAVETRHGDWVLFTCKVKVHQVADDKDCPKDNYCGFDIVDSS